METLKTAATVLGIVGAVVGIWVAIWQIYRWVKEDFLRWELWPYLKTQMGTWNLDQFSNDKTFVLAFIAYCAWAKQVVLRMEPAPQNLPTFKDRFSDILGEETNVESTMKSFFENWKQSECLTGDKKEKLYPLVAERIQFATTKYQFPQWRLDKMLPYHVWRKWRVSSFKRFLKGNEVLKAENIGEYAKYLRWGAVREFLLHLMNRQKRNADDEMALASLIAYTYQAKMVTDKVSNEAHPVELREKFRELMKPWGESLDVIVRFVPPLVKIIQPEKVETAERIAKGQNILWFSTLGGAWLLKYTASYLIHRTEPRDKYTLDELSKNLYGGFLDKSKGETEFHKQTAYGKFWENLETRQSQNRPLYVFLEHPFKPRVFWEVMTGENLRYPAEMIANRRALRAKFRDEQAVRVVWYREPYPWVGDSEQPSSEPTDGHTEDLEKLKFLLYTQVYSTFGRTRLNSRFVNVGTHIWKNEGHIYTILTPEYKFGNSRSRIINAHAEVESDSNKRKTGAVYASSTLVAFSTALCRQIAIDALLQDALAFHLSPGAELPMQNAFTVQWLNCMRPLDGLIGYGSSLGSSFSNPFQSSACGLLDVLKEEAEISWQMLAALKILLRWSETATATKPESKLEEEKGKKLRLSISVVNHYLEKEYVEEITAFKEFLVRLRETFNKISDSGVTGMQSLENALITTISSIQKSIDNLEAVRRDEWIDENAKEVDDCIKAMV